MGARCCGSVDPPPLTGVDTRLGGLVEVAPGTPQWSLCSALSDDGDGGGAGVTVLRADPRSPMRFFVTPAMRAEASPASLPLFLSPISALPAVGEPVSPIAGGRTPAPVLPPLLPAGMAAGVRAGPCRPHFVAQEEIGRYHDPEVISALRRGDVLFSFICAPGDLLRAEERACLAEVLRPTGFADELRENNVPAINMEDRSELAAHIFVLQWSSFVLPAPLVSAVVTPEVLASADFRRRVEPGNPVIYDNEYIRSQPNTFRMKKTVIPLVFSVTTQFRVSDVPEHRWGWGGFTQHLNGGLRADRVVVFERTKRDISKTNWQKKTKMVHVYHDLDGGGCLVSSVGALALTFLPGWLSPLVTRVGQRSAEDYAETASRTRAELLRLTARGGGATPPAGPAADGGGGDERGAAS